MNKKSEVLTQGLIWKKLLIFFLPILLGSLFQQLYTTVDAVIVGQFAGKNGLAAIDSVFTLLKLPINFLVGLSSGASIIISQLFGARKEHELSNAAHTAIAFAATGGLVLSVVGVIFAPQCLQLMDVPESIASMSLAYVRIYLGGLAFSMLYNIGASILRAMGNSKTPFYILIISGICNVVLDLIFVGLLIWGVAGAAFATIISQLVSAVLVCLSLVRSNGMCRISLSKLRFDRSSLKAIFMLGLPVAFQSSLYPMANMMIQASINGTGTDNIAAWALCGKLDFLIWLSAESLASAIATFAAQNYGAGQYGRMRKGVRIGLGMTLGIVFLISAVLYLWSEPLGKLFINAADYDIIPITGTLMRFLSPLYFLYVFGEVLSGAIRAAGQTFKPMLLTLFGTCVVRILWVLLVIPRNQSITTIISSYPVSWAITSLLFIIYYFYFKTKYLCDDSLHIKQKESL